MQGCPCQLLSLGEVYGWLSFVEFRKLLLFNVLLDVNYRISCLVWLNFAFRISNCCEQFTIARISNLYQIGHALERPILNLLILHVLL